MEWKSIITSTPNQPYENYKISTNGDVRNVKSNRILRQYRNKNTGYMNVTLCKEGKLKTFNTHRLVALTFIPNQNNLSDVDHIDSNKGNINVSNLQWLSNRQNIQKYHAEKKHALINLIEV